MKLIDPRDLIIVKPPLPDEKPSLVGKRFGAVVIQQELVWSFGTQKVKVFCERCEKESTTTLRTLQSREMHRGGETDCGCGKEDAIMIAKREKEKKQTLRDQIKAAKMKLKRQQEAAKDLSGKRIGHWIIIRAAKAREAKQGSGAGKMWIVTCVCGDEKHWIKSTGLITAQSDHCPSCAPKKRKKARPGSKLFSHSPRRTGVIS